MFIYKLVASNTVEEKIMGMQDRKRELAAQTLERGESGALAGLTSDDVLSLFAAEDDPAVGAVATR